MREVFFDELERVEANDFAAHIYERASTIGGIDGRKPR
jgi:hypothetical protein